MTEERRCVSVACRIEMKRDGKNARASQKLSFLYRMFYGCFVLETLRACEMWHKVSKMLKVVQYDLRDTSHRVCIRANRSTKLSI